MADPFFLVRYREKKSRPKSPDQPRSEDKKETAQSFLVQAANAALNKTGQYTRDIEAVTVADKLVEIANQQREQVSDVIHQLHFRSVEAARNYVLYPDDPGYRQALQSQVGVYITQEQFNMLDHYALREITEERVTELADLIRQDPKKVNWEALKNNFGALFEQGRLDEKVHDLVLTLYRNRTAILHQIMPLALVNFNDESGKWEIKSALDSKVKADYRGAVERAFYKLPPGATVKDRLQPLLPQNIVREQIGKMEKDIRAVQATVQSYLKGGTPAVTGAIGKAIHSNIPNFSSLLSKGVSKLQILVKGGIGKIVGAVLGSVVPGVGTVIGAVLGQLLSSVVSKALSKTFKWLALAFGGALVLILVVPFTLAVMVLIPFALFSGGGQAAAATPTIDLQIVAVANPSSGVGPSTTITVAGDVIPYADPGGAVKLSTQPGSHLTATGLSSVDFNLTKGQSGHFSLTFQTDASFSNQAIGTIVLNGTSPKLFSSITVYINRIGNPVGNDGKHAFPVLKSSGYSWSKCHAYPNYNAIDIFAPAGTPVTAAIGGRAQASMTELGGPVVFLYGDDGFNYYYAHLRINGRASGRVEAGDILGEIAGADEDYAKNNHAAHVHFSIDSRGIHDGPDTPAGDFLNLVEPNSKPKCTIGGTGY